MEDYIAAHGGVGDRRTFDEMRLISRCHSRAYRYPTIKAWFLERFPEIKEFGVMGAAEKTVEAPAEESKLTLAS